MDDAALEAQKKHDLEQFEEEIAQAAKLYPDYSKKEFTFTTLERTLLAEQDTIAALATQAKEHILNRYCLGRLNIEYSPDIRIYYSIGLSRFVVLTPRQTENAEKPKSSPKKGK